MAPELKAVCIAVLVTPFLEKWSRVTDGQIEDAARVAERIDAQVRADFDRALAGERAPVTRPDVRPGAALPRRPTLPQPVTAPPVAPSVLEDAAAGLPPHPMPSFGELSVGHAQPMANATPDPDKGTP
jgi:hypothetical protein